jgi:hypothetical protein
MIAYFAPGLRWPEPPPCAEMAIDAALEHPGTVTIRADRFNITNPKGPPIIRLDGAEWDDESMPAGPPGTLVFAGPKRTIVFDYAWCEGGEVLDSRGPGCDQSVQRLEFFASGWAVKFKGGKVERFRKARWR